MLLNILFDAVGSDHQFVQTDTAFVSRAAAGIAALGRMNHQFPVLVAVFLGPELE